MKRPDFPDNKNNAENKPIGIHINYRPLLFLVVGIAIGIFSVAEHPIPFIVLAFACAVSAALLCCFAKKRSLLLISVGIIIGMTRLFLSTPTKSLPDSGLYEITGRFYTQENNSLVLNDLYFNGIKTPGRLLIRKTNQIFNADDILTFSAKVSKTADMPESSYKNYLFSERISYSTDFNTCDSLKATRGKMTCHGMFVRLHKIAENLIYKTFGDDADIMCGILLGKSITQNYEIAIMRKVGIAHIFALSGLHITVLIKAFDIIFCKVGLYKRRNIACVFLLLYCAVAGFPVSLVRATIMYLISYAMFSIRLRYDPLSACSLSAIIILLFNPYKLFSAGFLLSYASIYGIILLSTPLAKLFESIITQNLSSALSVNIAVTLGILPVLYVFFGNIPTFSICINVLAVPLASLVVVLAFPAMILATIYTPLSIPIVFIIKVLLTAITALSKAVNALAFSTLTIGKVILISVLLYYVLLFILSEYVIMKPRLKLYASLALAALIVLL